ncbi:hypothetical protein Patl1_14562 [Pistacia atlantica]|uniref:Uncharacterized protein n=1 Tax=Pistacia atlantica TaxID=434234 RepID=A0ACC1AWF8_9ROSI|nr:hypothetical protein Patl1_14562 [Pistacia atlantica]
MSRVTSIFAFFVIALLWFFLSLLSSAQDQQATTLVPYSRAHVHEEDRLLSSFEPAGKLKIYQKRGGGLIGTIIHAIARGTSSAFRTQDQPAATLVPNSKVQVHEDGRFLSSAQHRKLKIFTKKGVRGGRGFGTGIATRARGRTSSAYRTSQISSFHFGSVFACSLFLGFLVL